jgi:hypothetical protein
MLKAIYDQVIMLNATCHELGERVAKLEGKFAVTATFMTLVGGLGGALVSAWRYVKGAQQ